MKRKLIALLALVVAASTFLAGCGKKTSTEDGERLTITVGYPAADESWKNDEYYKYITDKIGVNIEFETLSTETAAEKGRIWIASGDMPDVLYADFNLTEYLSYAEQGMVRELPEGWEERYPNVAFSMEMTGLSDLLKEKADGRIYSLIRPMDNFYEFIDEFRAAFAEDKDLNAMMSDSKYKSLDTYGFAYRKDWAEKLGIETDYIMEYEDFLDMARKFKEADLGGVGKNNTVGIAVDHTEAPQIFIVPFNSCYKVFHKDENGKYVYGLLEESTAEGVKQYAKAYREGLIAPDFYTQKASDLNSLFCSERSGIIYPRGSEYYLRLLRSDFTKANPDLKADDCIGICWVKSPDGTVHGREGSNYYGSYYFNPELSDEKMEKILELADYVSSLEGGPQVKLGVPDVDYKKEGNEYIITRDLNEDGTLPSLNEKYPSHEFFRLFLNPWYNQSVAPDPYAKECVANLKAAKRQYELNLNNKDIKRDLYSADDYSKFLAANDVNSLLTEVIISDGDIEENWNKKCKELEKSAKSVAANMNKDLLN